MGIPFLALLTAIPLWSTIQLERGGVETFWMLGLNAFGVVFIFNLVDWLLLDWLMFAGSRPALWSFLAPKVHRLITIIFSFPRFPGWDDLVRDCRIGLRNPGLAFLTFSSQILIYGPPCTLIMV